MMTDPVADMLTRIRNSVRIETPHVEMPSSKIRSGSPRSSRTKGTSGISSGLETVPARTLRLHVKYGPNGEKLITKIDRVSKPGCRKYAGYKFLKPILGGMGIQILSTPKGVLSDRRARIEKVGGELLAWSFTNRGFSMSSRWPQRSSRSPLPCKVELSRSITVSRQGPKGSLSFTYRESIGVAFDDAAARSA